jgi:hypothetical protein
MRKKIFALRGEWSLAYIAYAQIKNISNVDFCELGPYNYLRIL